MFCFLVHRTVGSMRNRSKRTSYRTSGKISHAMFELVGVKFEQTHRAANKSSDRKSRLPHVQLE